MNMNRMSVRKVISFDDEMETPQEEEEDEDIFLDVEVERSLEGHSMDISSVLCFQSRKKLVSCSADDTIRVYNIETGECDKIIDEHFGPVRQVIRFDKDIFLSCSWDAKIIAWSIETLSKIKEFTMNKVSVYQMLKIKERDLFLSVNENNKLYVISYNQNKIINELESQKICDNTKLANSLIFPYHFYINTSKFDKNQVHLIDYKENKKVRTFKKHVCDIHALFVFQNNLSEELIAVGGDDKFIYIYNNLSSKFKNSLTKKIECSGKVRSLFLFGETKMVGGKNGRVLGFMGNSNGALECFDFLSSKKETFAKIEEEAIHLKETSVYDLKFVSYSKDENTLRLASCGLDKTSKILKIEGIRYFGNLISEEIEFPKHDENVVITKQEPKVEPPQPTLPLPQTITQIPQKTLNIVKKPEEKKPTPAAVIPSPQPQIIDPKAVTVPTPSPGPGPGTTPTTPGTPAAGPMGENELDELGNDVILLRKHVQEKDQLIQVFLQRLKDKDVIIRDLQLKIAKVKQILLDNSK